MMVCAHGDVAEFCAERGMVIFEKCDDLEHYTGVSRIIVTDQEMSEYEYYYLKGKLLGRGVELVSTRHTDDTLLAGFLAYQADRRKKNYGGRQRFGYRKENGVVVPTKDGMDVVNRILELRDAGFTLRKIQEDKGVHHPDGRPISISTIQQLIKNREKYK